MIGYSNRLSRLDDVITTKEARAVVEMRADRRTCCAEMPQEAQRCWVGEREREREQEVLLSPGHHAEPRDQVNCEMKKKIRRTCPKI